MIKIQYLKSNLERLHQSILLRKKDIRLFLNIKKVIELGEKNFKEKDQTKKKILEQKIKLIKKELDFLPNYFFPEVKKKSYVLFSYFKKKKLNKIDFLYKIFFSSKVCGKGFLFVNAFGTFLFNILKNKMQSILQKNFFREVIVPIAMKEEGFFNSAHLPFFQKEMWSAFCRKKMFYLLPTAEASLTNFPLDFSKIDDFFVYRIFAFTPCFRTESGKYGKRDSGFCRLFQFWKNEMYVFCNEKNSRKEEKTMLNMVKEFLIGLDINFKIVVKSCDDIADSAAITYDVLCPTLERGELEISSISNCTDFQSRRMLKKNIHTLNGSFFPLERFMNVFIENCIEEYNEKEQYIILTNKASSFLQIEKKIVLF